jgi:H+/Cl- antiporter ClcA/CBS domain-containing protein
MSQLKEENLTHNNVPPPDIAESSTTDGLPVAAGMGEVLQEARVPHQDTLVDRRVLLMSALAILLGFAAAFIAFGLVAIINFVTNLSFYGRVSLQPASPAGNALGVLVVLPPVIGGVIVGLMARYGSKAIRGHGIPEAMEQVLLNESRIPPRITILKPLSSAIAIGSGGPFGAEGPIIATGGALGSFIGQLVRTTAIERKVLLSAGAAAGMTAIFASPIAAVILAVELLLFEFSPRSIIPVALACVSANGMRVVLMGNAPPFPMESVTTPGLKALAFYVLLGALIGVFAIGVTKLVYAIEDGFEKLPVHWMWWPAIGGVAVGIVGYFAPHTLGVGYDNIENILSGKLVGQAVFILCAMKLISWSISLGSGTSGGTLAPLFTIGGGAGSLLGAAGAGLFPAAAIDLRLAALVGMAATFAGSSRALLTSVVFAFETTRQPAGLLPLLGGCTAAYLVSCLWMRHTIMTEKIARRGVRVPAEYAADFLHSISVREAASPAVVTLDAEQTLESVREWLAADSEAAHHQGYPVLDENEQLIGVVTRRNLMDAAKPGVLRVRDLILRAPAIVYDDNSLREAADHMVNEKVGRLPVVSREEPGKIVGILTRSDLLSAHAQRLDEAQRKTRHIRRGQSAQAGSTPP